MSDQEILARLWEEHIRYEFATKSTDDTIATMVEDAYVNHVPVMTSGSGKPELRQFYAAHFIPKMIDPARLPVAGAESARKVLDPRLPAHALIRQF